jgi:hypothetical protein
LHAQTERARISKPEEELPIYEKLLLWLVVFQGGENDG